MVLNDKESKIIELIRDDPFISQKELSELIGLSRSAIANMISGLVKKGYLLGKAYVINDNRPVVCIGAANIDTRYKIQEQLYFNRTNEVQTEHSLGGVARNIAETLERLETDVQLLSVIGNDISGKNIRTTSKYLLNLRDIEILDEEKTGSFVEVVDRERNVVLNMVDVSLYDHMTPAWVLKHLETIKRARCLVADTNCPKETLEYLTYLAKECGILMIIVTSSVQTMINLPDDLEGINLYIKHDEAEVWLQRAIQTDEELSDAVRTFQARGLQSVFITKNNEKVAFGYGNQREICNNPENANSPYCWGMNEAMCAAVVHYYLKGEKPEVCIKAGVLNAFLTTRTEKVVRPSLSVKRLQLEVERYLIG